MITYLLKMLACSALFFGAYKLLYQNEKAFRFNRFFLLSTLLLSFFIPFITFNFSAPVSTIADNEIVPLNFIQADNTVYNSIPAEKKNFLPILFFAFYAAMSLFFLFRFIVNIRKIILLALKNIKISLSNYKIVLLNENLLPYSFLQYLFVNKNEYEQQKINEEILIHEYAHIHQKHSLDILLIELLQIFFWFNPFLFLYKKAIRLNHEFLADEAVINSSYDIEKYQLLLIEKSSCKISSAIANQFNFLITKKRLIMMHKTKSFAGNIVKQIAFVPVLILSVYLFSTKTFSQDKQQATKKTETLLLQTPSTQEGATQAQMDEYEQIVTQYTKDSGYRSIYKRITEEDKKRLEQIFVLMNQEQQQKQTIVFMKAPMPSKKEIPTEKQLKLWKNPNLYGVWIDGKHVSNSELNKYKNTDFSYYNASNLRGGAKKGKIYSVQLDLMTNDYYKKYYKETMEWLKTNKYIMGIKRAKQ